MSNKNTNSNPQNQNPENQQNKRFTTTINPQLLSQIKLISYFTNQTLSQSINQSIQLFITNFETQNNTSIQSIINLQNTQK